MDDNFGFEENWEDIEETPAYTFLKSMQTLVNSKSKTGKNTRKFLRLAADMVTKKEISQSDLDYYIENEDIDKKIVDSVKSKLKPKTKSSTSGSSRDDGCGGGGYMGSSC